MINLLYYEHLTDKQKYFYVNLFYQNFSIICEDNRFYVLTKSIKIIDKQINWEPSFGILLL